MTETNGSPHASFFRNVDVEAILKGLAVGTAVLYVAGFLVANAHLSKFGYYDYSLANPRFLLAGGICTAVFICWFQIAGRHIIHGPEDLAFALKLLGPTASVPWGLIAFLESTLINFIFYPIAAAAVFSGLILEPSPAILAMSGPLAIFFLVVYPLDVANVDLSHPRLFLSVNITLKLSYIAFALLIAVRIGISPLIFAAIIYGTMSQLANSFLDVRKRYRLGTTSLASLVAFTVLYVFAGVVAFGFYLFGDVQARFGGGSLQDVAITLRSSHAQSAAAIDAKLIYLNDRILLFEQEGHPTLVDLKDVAMIQFRPKTYATLYGDALKELTEKLRGK